MRLGGARKAALIAAAVCGQIALMGQARVPFVGCETHGMQDLAAPKGRTTKVAIAAGPAKRLALYAGVSRVLAPRGWHCLGDDGSYGVALLVKPGPVADPNHTSGPGVEIERIDSGAYGRFAVAEIIAQVFPDHRDFVDRVRVGFEFERMPAGPSPTDRLTYKSPAVVEYETPAQTDGLGTRALQKGADPIRGVAILAGTGDQPDVVMLYVRLPKGMEDLAPVIIQQVEREAVVYRK